MSICIFPGCSFRKKNTDYCIIHNGFLPMADFPHICSISACCCITRAGNIKGRGMCVKHIINPLYCSHKNCKNIPRGHDVFCKRHVGLISCLKSSCIENKSFLDNGYCLRHYADPSLCCAKHCKAVAVSPSDNCIDHFKDKRFCSVKDCFRRLNLTTDSICPAHSRNIACCVIIGCRNTVVCNGLCETHLSETSFTGLCSVFTCGAPIYTEGLCFNHSSIVKDTGGHGMLYDVGISAFELDEIILSNEDVEEVVLDDPFIFTFDL